jgi:hypothetical protein
LIEEWIEALVRWTRYLVVCCALLTTSPSKAQTIEPVPTYTGEVSTILQRHCNGCHRTGGVGRIALDSFEQARAFAPEIRNSIGTRKMPPWLAVAGFGEFENDPSLSLQEMETLIHWADGKAPKGPPITKAAAPLRTSKWPFGTPDLILEPKAAIYIPATGDVECRCFVIQTQADKSRVVRAIDVIPSDPRLVEYVRVFANSKATKARSVKRDSRSAFTCAGELSPARTRTSLGEWSAGNPPQWLPAGIGRPLPAKADVVVEIRYRRIGFRAADRSQIGIYFQREPVQHLIQTKAVLKVPVRVRAREWNLHAETEWQTNKNFTLLSISPYMRERGTEMKATAVLPDGTTRNLVWVREYDPNRQMAYVFREPIFLPRGTRVKIDGYFDNSGSNPRMQATGAKDVYEVLAAFLEILNSAD